MVTGRSGIDLHECDINRFDACQLAPAYVRDRAIRAFEEVYDIIHPLDPPSIRDVRVSAFECDWLFMPEVVRSGNDLSQSVELFDRVNRQDFAACERCQPGMSSRAYASGGVLVPSEHHIGAFHEWIRRKTSN